MEKQTILGHDTGGMHDRSRKVESHGYSSRRRESLIQSHMPAGRGKSGQWKPKLIDNRICVSSNLSNDRASTSQHSSSDVDSQSSDPRRSPDHVESNETREESQSNELLGNESYDPHSIDSLYIDEPAIPHQRCQDVCGMKDRSDATCSEDFEELSGSSFDICSFSEAKFILRPALFFTNREMRNEIKLKMDGSRYRVLRPGMVLLKSYLTHVDQVKIVQRCRQIGKGSGGFYQPGYRDGATLHLKMMCLGKNWDPSTGEYGSKRRDGAKPPSIPPEFFQIVEDAIQKSQELVSVNSRSRKQVIPSMAPDICIVNFYKQTGKLGLHQDKDESRESINGGLPVVSFSIGDSGDFLYGDYPDSSKAEKVVLESGDILIFGGDSRRVFHGVPAIHPKSAPSSLVRETNILPGRLNLTFRKY